MQKNGHAPFGALGLFAVALSIALTSAFIWAATAQAQSPTEDQYGGPNVPFGPALGPGGVAVEDNAEEPADDGTAVDATGTAATGSAAAGGVSQFSGPATEGVLPATGGVALFVYVGVFAAALGTGLVVLRRSGRGE